MDIGIIITGVLGVITSLASSWITWFFTRKKYNAEVDNTIINGMKESLEFYQRLSDDNKRRLDIVLVRNSNLEKELGEVKNRIIELTTTICTDLSCQLRKRYNETTAKKDS